MGCSGSRSDLVKPQDLLTEASEARTEAGWPDGREVAAKFHGFWRNVAGIRMAGRQV